MNNEHSEMAANGMISAEPIKRTLAGLKQKGTLKKWREEKGHLPVRIWSGEWHSYWRANGCGYTTDINEAGVYTLDSAISHSGHCDPSKKIEYHFLPETPKVQP